MTNDIDVQYMKLAIDLAKTGMYTARPNPSVGCVLVKNIDGEDKKIGQGYHFKAGEPHAEINAMQDAKNNGYDIAGSTAYVTLEPCSHTGKTPPCANALVDANVAKVVVAMIDPNPKVAGKGISILKDAGIEVVTGVCETEAKKLNKGFLKVMSGGLPYVRMKIASSMDGSTAMASGESKWITGKKARAEVQHWRAISGAIVTGSETVLSDDPNLNVRFGFKRKYRDILLEDIKQPIRIVMDRRGRVDMNFSMMHDGQMTIVYGDDGKAMIDTSLTDMLEELRDEHNVNDVLIEAGGTLSGAFLEQNLVDEIILYQAPIFLGTSARTMLNFEIETLAQAQKFKVESTKIIGEDIRTILVRP